MQYTSVFPKAYKLSMLICYLNKAPNLYTRFVDFKKEVLKLQNTGIEPIMEQLIQTRINIFL